ncbi:hypothetical protein [Microtetraspora sp. NBRC 16547]|uniref:hypothetical protein n=1 Tax=Microtetraspora sp. NBRC 16547 TaxID=3030993 RepID=UPI0024A028FA|nr:hypothetical protein [Microtetraspora sp. NBRC 16547]GLW97098.1 hypothetical protein Misp02_11850 [Microtetraspora sp. NBRC 16547]
MISLVSYYTDLALGLVLAFMLLSLLVSGVNEGIVRILGIRSRFLWAYLRDTLDGAEVGQRIPAAARTLMGVLGRLRGLGRWLHDRLADLLPPPGAGRSRLPATVLGVFAKLPFGRDPRPAFAPRPAPVESPPLAGATARDPGDPAVASTAAPSAGSAGEGESLTDLLHERLQEIDHSARGRTTIAQIPPARFAVALLEIATDMGGVERLMRELDTLKSPLYRPVKAVWDRASHDVEAFRKGVEDWFDGEMERLTILYRRYVRWVIAALSLTVTVLFGMDALEYGKSLLNDNAYRSSVAAFAQSGPDALEPLKERCEPGQDTYSCVTDVLSTPAFVQIFTHAPVAVEMRADSGPAWSWRGGDWWSRVSSPSHWPGYLITLIALLFGAPFWWDIFRRVTGIRSRVSTPDR